MGPYCYGNYHYLVNDKPHTEADLTQTFKLRECLSAYILRISKEIYIGRTCRLFQVMQEISKVNTVFMTPVHKTYFDDKCRTNHQRRQYVMYIAYMVQKLFTHFVRVLISCSSSAQSRIAIHTCLFTLKPSFASFESTIFLFRARNNLELVVFRL